MNTTSKFSQAQLCLPNIDLVESSEQAFSEAFLKAARMLHQQMEQIKSATEEIKDFMEEPFNLAIFGLFSKMCRHYYSYVLLEINHDWIGSEFLIEHVCEAAITLTYLLEEVDESLLSEYISASAYQAHSLLTGVRDKLRKFPNHQDLLMLRDELETFIAKHQEYDVEHPLSADSKAYSWGSQEADTTSKRGAALGLNFLSNPARQIALKVMPASWLELQLNYANSFGRSSRTKATPDPNFTTMRDASHLCLHATQSFLEEVVNYQYVDYFDIQSQLKSLNVLYEWFHHAHNAYQRRCCVKIQEANDFDRH